MKKEQEMLVATRRDVFTSKVLSIILVQQAR